MRVLLLAILLYPITSFAEYPTYEVLISNLQQQSSVGTKFKISKSKTDYKIEEITFGKKRFKLDIQDHFFNDQPVPLFEVNLKSNSNFKLFALLATTGTSGRSFHYFIDRGKGVHYSGHHPEIFFDEETQSYLSIEVDGPRKYLTTWELKKKGFVLIKTEELK